MEKLKFELREYKGFRYVVAPVQSLALWLFINR